MTGSSIDTSSPMVRATLGLRLVIEIGLFAGIVAAANMNYDGTTVWIASGCWGCCDRGDVGRVRGS